MPGRMARFVRGAMAWTRPGPGLSLACLTALVVACYGGVLFGGGQFAFRDSAHFYYPLYWRVQQEWSAGRLPLWEPGENGGTPMLGSPMAAVLYPGKVLFALVPYGWGVRLYTVGHEVLAFWAMLALMRGWGVSWTGATLAGLSYAFGGVVLSDYFNIIYLVGAAWLPLGIRAADGWLRHGSAIGPGGAGPGPGDAGPGRRPGGGLPHGALCRGLCPGPGKGRRTALRPGPAHGHWGWLVVAVGWIWAGPALLPWFHGSGGRTGPAVVASAWVLGIVAYALSRRSRHRARLAAMFLGLTIAGNPRTPAGGGPGASGARAHRGEPALGGGPAGRPLRFQPAPLPDRRVDLAERLRDLHGRESLLDADPAPDGRGAALAICPSTPVRCRMVLALGAAGFRGGPPWRAWMTAVALLSFWASLGEFAGAGSMVGRGRRPPRPATAASTACSRPLCRPSASSASRSSCWSSRPWACRCWPGPAGTGSRPASAAAGPSPIAIGLLAVTAMCSGGRRGAARPARRRDRGAGADPRRLRPARCPGGGRRIAPRPGSRGDRPGAEPHRPRLRPHAGSAWPGWPPSHSWWSTWPWPMLPW